MPQKQTFTDISPIEQQPAQKQTFTDVTPVDNSSSSTPPEKPGFVKRFAQGMGIPTSVDELASAASPATIGGVPVAAPGSALATLINYGKNLYEKTTDAAHKRDLQSGLDALAALTPAGGTQKTIATDAASGNIRGAAGGAASLVTQAAAPEALERFGPQISDTAKVLTDPAVDAASELPIVDKVVKAGRALSKYSDVPGQLADIWKPKRGAIAQAAAPPVDPSVTSPSRTMPGQIAPEPIRPQQQTAAPIPKRGGLSLPPAPKGAELGEIPVTQTSALEQSQGLGQAPKRGSIAQTMKETPPAQLPAAFQDLPPKPPAVEGTADAPFQGPARTEPPADMSDVQAKQITRKSLQQLLQESLGGRDLDPKLPIRDQLDASTRSTAAPDLPEGHTPVQSSALRSYKYDSAAREFHARATSGDTTYVYGDVSPEDAAEFESSKSKGQAWQNIRRNPLVAKIVNGKRTAITAPTR